MNKSIVLEKKMSMIPFILIAVVLAVTGQLFVKKGLNVLGTMDFSSGIFMAYLQVYKSPLVLIGTFIYLLSILFWIYALSKVELSFAYPFLALSYVLVILASWLILGEKIPFLRWLGLIVICIGVFIISRSY